VIERSWLRARATAGAWLQRVSASMAGRKWASLSTRSQRIVGAGGAAALVLTLVAGMAFVAGAVSPQGAIATASPQIAIASASPSPVASPSSTASSAPTPPSDSAVIASVDCSADGPTATADGVLYVSCGGMAGKPTIIAIDLATDKVVKTYTLARQGPKCQTMCLPLGPYMIDVLGGLWIEWTDSVIQRLDLTSGNTTSEVSDAILLGDASGSIWIQTDRGLVAVSPNGSLPKSVGPFGAGQSQIQLACGSIWQGDVTGLSAYDPATGLFRHVLGTESTSLGVTIGLGSTCWMETHVLGKTILTSMSGQCVGGAAVTVPQLPFQLGDATWILKDRALFQFDMTTGETYGLPHAIPDGNPSTNIIVEAAGQVWTDDGDHFVRIALPLNPIPGQVPFPPLTCSAASPSPSPSASPSPFESASPSASPTMVLTATPTAASTPVSTELPSVSPEAPTDSPPATPGS